MDQNIKYAIYFLLGIILFYLLFNEKGVEGFDATSPSAYNITIGGADALPLTCTKRDNNLDEITRNGITGTTTNPLLTNILSNITVEKPIHYSDEDNQLILIQSNSSICINSDDSVVEQESVAWTQANCAPVGSTTNVYAAPTCTPTDASEWTSDTCTAAGGTFAEGSNCTPTSGDVWTAANCPATLGAFVASTCTPTGATAALPETTVAWTADNCSGDNNLVTYFYIIHIVINEAEPTTRTTDIYRSRTVDGTYLKYATDAASVASVPEVLPENVTVTVTAVPASTCATWFTSNNCASGKVNNSGTTPCPVGTCSQDICCSNAENNNSNSHDYYCNNGSAVDGSSSTHTQRCASCNDGYTKRGRICVQNGSCSTFITETNKCDEGKEVIDDKSCSGACSKVVCCEDESDAMMIGIGVGGLILFLIMLGGGVYVVMGNKPPLPLPQTR
jgi:hypothetical protein